MSSTEAATRTRTLGRRIRAFADGAVAAEPRAMTRRDMWIFATLLILGVVLCLARLPRGGISLLWAEDASVFVTDAYAGTWWSTVLEPYNGYAHVVPRTIASLVVSFVDIDHVPLAITVAACIVTSIVAAVIAWAMSARITNRWAQVAIWAVVVTLPVAGTEVNGSIANSHWYLLAGLFAVLSVRASSVPGIVASGVLVALAVLSDPLALVFAPLCVLHVLAHRRPRWWIVPVCYAAALLVQFAVVATTQLQSADATSTFGGLLRAISFRVFLESLVGTAGSAAVYASLGTVGLVLATVTIVAITVLTIRSHRIAWAVTAVVAAIAFFVVSAGLRWFPGLDPALGQYGGGSRYGVVPVLILTIVFGVTAGTIPMFSRRSSILVSVGMGAIATALLLSVALGWGTSARAASIPWSVELEQRRHECSLDPSSTVRIGGSPDGFAATIACVHLIEES